MEQQFPIAQSFLTFESFCLPLAFNLENVDFLEVILARSVHAIVVDQIVFNFSSLQWSNFGPQTVVDIFCRVELILPIKSSQQNTARVFNRNQLVNLLEHLTKKVVV